jgi:hypothetical protein
MRLTEPGFFYNSRPRCEFCGKEHKDNCDFAFDEQVKFKEVL